MPEDMSTCVKLENVLKATETQMDRELRGMVSIPPVWQSNSSDVSICTDFTPKTSFVWYVRVTGRFVGWFIWQSVC